MSEAGSSSTGRLAFVLCLSGIAAAVLISILGKVLNEDLSMIAFACLVGLEIAALALGIVSRARPLGKAAVATSSILLLGSLLYLS